MATRITIRKPDDWHLHVRDGAMLKASLPFTARHFGRAILMPNLVPPVTTTAEAVAYRERVLAALPSGSTFKPLMTCYLTDDTDPDDVTAEQDAAEEQLEVKANLHEQRLAAVLAVLQESGAKRIIDLGCG